MPLAVVTNVSLGRKWFGAGRRFKRLMVKKAFGEFEGFIGKVWGI
jgi:hypothetical protein